MTAEVDRHFTDGARGGGSCFTVLRRGEAQVYVLPEKIAAVEEGEPGTARLRFAEGDHVLVVDGCATEIARVFAAQL
jgi:uncharacterized metal-binding protein